MKLEGGQFKNSETCSGLSYRDDETNVDISKIDISGRYPESGWAVNEVAHEMVYVARGTGSLARKDQQAIALTEGDVVSVAPGKRFAWDGDMTIIMACNPPFNPNQYNLEDSDEI
jgi:tRNA1(Val) A37 N6-methylase TrmN6